MHGLEFDEETHRYRLDGVRIPGVTECLKLVSSADYANVPAEVMAAKSALGSAVHSLIELDCANDLDVDGLDDQLVPYYGAWREFLTASGFQVILSESLVVSRRYGYAGKLDLFGSLNGIRATIDAKCVTTIMSSTGPQTAGYTQALRETRPDLLAPTAPCRRFALQLRPALERGHAARWNLVPFTQDAADLRLFLACATVTQHLLRNSSR